MVAAAERTGAVTALLRSASAGSAEALERLVPLIYGELRAIAHRQLRAERAGHTLNTTALVHEAYLKLVDQREVDWQGRAHFFSVAARVMRRILVDYARRRGAAKRGAQEGAVALDAGVVPALARAPLVVALDEALERLAAFDERQCRVVEYRYFVGLTEAETAELLGVSVRTVRNDWVKAKGWLLQELRADGAA
jgi:RNA polymerase sigma-70 factor, ECF subfamily